DHRGREDHRLYGRVRQRLETLSVSWWGQRPSSRLPYLLRPGLETPATGDPCNRLRARVLCLRVRCSMRVLLTSIVIAGMLLTSGGCRSRAVPHAGPKKYYEGPTVPAFSGQVVQDGEPVTFPEDEVVIVKFTVIEGDSMGKTFGVPIKPDGTFNIGWM